jgi:hypothetical protein
MKRASACGVMATGVWLGALAVAQPLIVPPPTQPAPAPGEQPAPEPSKLTEVRAAPAPTVPISPELDAFLDRMESADRQLTSLKASVRLIRSQPEILGGGEDRRYGTLSFATQEGAPGQPALRRFAIRFEVLGIMGPDGKEERRADLYDVSFDGQWIIERWPEQKTFLRRLIVAPGSGKDPLRIGEGPFPLPIGQRKGDMLARFDISMPGALDSAPTNARLRELLGACTQLRLVPKVDTPGAKDFREIRLWFRAADALPIFGQTVNLDGTKAEVFLLDVKRNEPVDAAVFNTTPPSAADGWKGDVVDSVQVK